MSNCFNRRVCDVLREGTGIFVEEDDFSWEGRALSQEGRDRTSAFRYSFDPTPDVVMFTGIYDAAIHNNILPTRYLAAFEFQASSYRIWYQNSTVTTFATWFPGQRFTLQYEAGRVRAYVDNEEVWDSDA